MSDNGDTVTETLDWGNDFEAIDEATWRARVERDLKGRAFDKLRPTLFDGVRTEPLYTRGPEPDPQCRGGGRGAGWVIAQAYDLGDTLDVARALESDAQLGAKAAVIDAKGHPAPQPETSTAWVEALGDGGTVFVLRGAALRQAPMPMGAVTVLDPLAELAQTGRWSAPLDVVRRGFAEAAGQGGALVGLETNAYAHAGATATQQLGIMLATGATYLRWAETHGRALDEVVRGAWASFAIGHDLFVEIAKLRAARRLWAQLMASCGVSGDARQLHVHATGSRRERTARDPWVNLLRATTESFSAAVGGADSIAALPLDVALDGRPAAGADFGRRLAVNTQVLLREESHLAVVADPAGGSSYVESLTVDLARAGWTAFVELEREGGLFESLRAGRLGARISIQHEAEAKDVAKRKQAIIGVSEFPLLEEHAVPRDVAASVDVRPSTVMPGAVEIEPLPIRRLAEPFEELRRRADRQKFTMGRRPRACLLGLGPLPEHKPRADFARNLLMAGGFEVELSDPVLDPSDAKAAVPPDIDVVVLCSSDELYASHAVAVAEALRDGGARLALAGRPGELESALASAGLTTFLYLGCDAISLLDGLLTARGEG